MTEHKWVCERCGSNEHVREGLCRHCRKVMLGEGQLLGPEHEQAPRRSDLEPLHNPPWRRRGA